MEHTANGPEPQRLGLTWFEGANVAKGFRRELTWPEFVEWGQSNAPVAADKASLPLAKLATFAGDYRSNHTLETIYGIEGDYDAGTVQPAIAAAMLASAGICGLIVTTPSHRPDEPRWRAWCPLSQPMQPAERHGLVARLNGALGGVLAPESFTASQAFYVGSVAGGEPVQCFPVGGAPIDLVDSIAPIGPPQSAGERHPLGTLPTVAREIVEAALAEIDPGQLDYPGWRDATAAYRGAGGTREPWDRWCAQYDANDHSDNDKLWRSLDSGTALGWDYLARHAPLARAAVTFGAGAVPVAIGGDSRLSHIPTREADFWSTWGADDGARATSIAAIRAIVETGVPVRHDMFADRIVIISPVPWDRTGPFPRMWQDTDTTGCKAALEMQFLKPSKDTTLDAVAFVAKRSPFHPVRDYLDSLSWDGLPRLDEMPALYMGALNTQFARLAMPKFMIQAVARIQEPGCKADAMLVLEGEQGIKKSTFANTLFGDEWFADDLPDMRSKDAAMQLRGKWGIEIGEMVAASKGEVNAVKRFIAAKKDTYRPPYGRATIDAERHTVFVGTTNDFQYLTDPTGNRRFWPIACNRFDIAAVKRDRDQLWAEAMHRWRGGEPWHLSEAEEALAAVEQEARREADVWESPVLGFIAFQSVRPFEIADALKAIGVSIDRQDMAAQRRMGKVLRALRCDHLTIQGRKRWRASAETVQRIAAEGVTVGDPANLPDGHPQKPQKS